MRNGYWWIEALLGLLLIAAPFLWHFTELRAATYTDVILGILVIVWALVGYRLIGGVRSRDASPTHA
jgi:SPW repeat